MLRDAQFDQKRHADCKEIGSHDCLPTNYVGVNTKESQDVCERKETDQ